MPSAPKSLTRAEATIADWAAAYPEVVEERPWGHRAFKVRAKTFMFLTLEGDSLGFSLKLPQSGLEVLGLPFAEPTGYGLGKSGWVSFSFGPSDAIPLELVAEWLRESFVAIAPKKLSNALLTPDAAPEPMTHRSKSAPAPKPKAPAKAKAKAAPTATTKKTKAAPTRATKKATKKKR